jgi:uncharacterized protein YegL
MSNSNSKQWSSATPGYIIFLVDQSGSMAETYAEGKTRSEFTAQVINSAINEIINSNMEGLIVKDRAFISIIGYGGSSSLAVDDIRSDYLSSFADNPLRTQQVKKKISNGAGGLVEIDEQMPIFIEPTSNGLTPMAEAFSFAKELIEGWLQKKPDNPAPIIINVSDGMPYTGGSMQEAMNRTMDVSKELMNINSADGNPLIFNCHLGEGKSHHFNESTNEIADEQAKFLFEISSELPKSYKDAAIKYKFEVKPNSRVFVSNAKPEYLIKLIDFGSGGPGQDLTA